MIAYIHKHWRMVSVYSVTHFLVDFSCAFLMFRNIVGTPDGYLCVLLYNFCAFAMQMPLGILADKWNRNYLFATIGCVFVGLAYGLWHIPIAAAVIVGIGNGMFHVGGGIDVLNISEEKSGALGIFVSPGAFGIYFGTMLGKGNVLTVIPVLLALLIAAALIIFVHRVQSAEYVNNAAFTIDGGTFSKMLTAAALLLLVVCLRSYVGLTLSFPWKGTGYWAVALVCAVVFGKTAGGFASDRFGAAKTACVSLGIAALLFLVPQIPAAGVLSLLLFNMTMPITLWAMAKIFPGAKGFSFGLLTFGLFLGFLPVYLGANPLFNAPWLFALAAIASLVLLCVSLRRYDYER